VTTQRSSGAGAVWWLTAQSVLFGAMAALLGIVANALFLEAHGSRWLPVTYILIGVAGVAISMAIARSAERFDLLRIAVTVLGGAAFLFAGSWLIATAPGGAWVSGALLVLFPILIQLGFVFIGGQAGRVLDIAGIKASYPRIMTGFPLGAVLGGMAAVPLVDVLGRSEDLLLVTALVEAAFAGVVWATGRRYASLLVLPVPNATDPATQDADGAAAGRSIRGLLRQPFVVLILAYQALSALGSQLSDFLVFDRAAAAYQGANELAQFVGVYTAVMNAVSIGFLFLVAGPLLRRFGLRLGLAANPVVLLAFGVGMLMLLPVAGAASFALLGAASAARIADVALTDGTNRTSITTAYQVVPHDRRLVAQAVVEGMGVPIAIGFSGVLLLVLHALPAVTATLVVALTATCAAWTWVALRLYRAYGPALVAAVQGRRLLDPDAGLEATVDDATATARLLAAGDPAARRLGFELGSRLGAPAMLELVAPLAQDPRTDVRLLALGAMAAGGDARAQSRLGAEVRVAARSPHVDIRRHAALAAAAVSTAHRAAVAGLLDDGDQEVRRAALDSVQAGDAFAVEPALTALREPRYAQQAGAAVGRLGDAAVPALAAALAGVDGTTSMADARRLVRSVSTPSAARDAVLAAHVRHPDRGLGLLVIGRLTGADPAPQALARELDRVVDEEVDHVARILSAAAAIANDGTQEADIDGPVLTALADERVLVGRRVAAALLARHGRDRLGRALEVVTRGGEGAGLAAEALEVALGHTQAGTVAAIVDGRLEPAERLRRLSDGRKQPAHGGAAWLRDIAEDGDDRWRSEWLRACAIRALRLRRVGAGFDPAAARRSGDPVVLEELELVGSTA
jgi:hypothetical protein